MTIEEAIKNCSKELEHIKTTKFSEIDVPNEVMGIVVARKNKSRFNFKEMIFVMLDLPNFPIIALTNTIAMNINNLEENRKYKFRRYDLYYTKEKTGKKFHSFCYDRGEEFSVVGNANKLRYYQARK